MSQTHFSRRFFLQASAAAGGGLLLKCAFKPSDLIQAQSSVAASKDIALNAWLRISPDDRVTIISSQAEMGQGIMTTLPAVLAEELGADWTRVQLENAPADPTYRNPRINWQFTGNSESTTAFYDVMRTMGASAREMLIAAAADRWRANQESCHAENGRIIHRPTGRSFKFGDLAEAAAKKTPPANPPLKPPREWRLIGKSLPRVETHSKINGTAVFGIDFAVPGMVYAAVRTSPVFGGKVVSWDRGSVEAFGVIDVVAIPDGVAVVAKSYWQAKRALDALKVTFEDGPNASVSSDTLKARYRAAMDGNKWLLVHATGDRDAIPHSYPNVPLDKEASASTDPGKAKLNETYPTMVSEEYESQFLAHATMEPMNCTAYVTAEACDVWGPTQGQELAQIVVCQMLNLPKDKVRISRTLLGGGFGRRLTADFVVQAVAVSKAIGLPVKVIWSREEDIQHDVYRPAVLHRITAAIDEFGRLRAMAHRLVSASILQYVSPTSVTDIYDPSCLEGLIEPHYNIPNNRVDFQLLKVPVPTSVMRTTGYGPNIFALESFIDELAYNKGADPYTYRRELLADSPRALAVLDLAAEKSGWRNPASPGHHRGIAFCEAFRTFICHVVELSVPEVGVIKIHRVVIVADAGTVLDPGITANSLEGGVAFGLSYAVQSEITFDRGRVVQSNFHDYQIPRMPEMPPVEVYFINSGARPLGGTGEVGPVTFIPALASAVFAATGNRYRSLPLSRHGLRLA